MKNYAGFFQRLVGYIIDALIISVPLGILFKNSEENNAIQLIVWTVYYVWMLGKYGQTVGKMVMKIKVVKEDGSPISYSDALIRELTSYLSAVVLFLGFLWVIWDSKKQAWHDKIVKTIVVKV